MTVETPQGDALIEDQLQDLEQQLVVLRKQLARWTSEVAAGELGSGADGKRMLSDVSGWIRKAMDLEKELDERKRNAKGIAPGRDYAIDFDAARTEIGCRLARLRRCRGADDLSE